jgi:hypothetical protein
MLIARININYNLCWASTRVGELNSGLERGFFNRCFYDVLCKLATFTTLASHAQFFADILICTRTTIHKFLDLTVGYSFAKTNIHGY